MKNLGAGRFIGIAYRQDSLAIVTMAQGCRISDACFPATTMSAEAIRIYLGDQEGAVGVAVDSALIGLALDLGRNTLATTTLVASSTAGSAEMLARYAGHAL